MKGFCRWAAAFLALSLCLVSAEARILGETPEGYIHALQTPAGQDICFVSPEKEPAYKMEDVNFDGAEDIVVFVRRGASNDFAEFYLWNGTGYAWTRHDLSEGGIVNYTLLPDSGMVLSKENDGTRDFSAVLFKWAGDGLEPARAAMMGPYIETLWEDDVYIEKTYADKVVARVYEGESLLMEEVFSGTEENIRAAYKRQWVLLTKGER